MLEIFRKIQNKIKSLNWEKFKDIINRILHPHIAFILILVPVSVALLVYAFVYEGAQSAISYISYVLSAYALTVVCINIVPLMFRKAKNFKEQNKYINRYVTDTNLRVTISLYGSLLINTAYAIFQLGLGFYHASVWFYALSAYYILLAIMRFFLLRDVRAAGEEKDMLSELKRYRFCGVLLAVMNIALAVIVFYIAWQNRGFEHHAITAITMAAYTFTSFTLAIINVVKYRKYKSPIYSATKAISLAAASVSVLTLETAMLTAFGQEHEAEFRQIMTSTTGAAVCLFVLFMAIYMIVNSTKQINKLKNKL